MSNGSVYSHLTAPELVSFAEAERFIVFCDGLEEAGQVTYARHGRKIARDQLRALANLDAERSARRAMQEARDRLQTIIGQGAYEECVARERRDRERAHVG